MKGYVIGNLDIRDWQSFQLYRDRVGPLIRRHGGRYIVRGGRIEDLEGRLGFKRLVIIEFPSMAAAKAFYDSPDYGPVKDIRLRSAVTDLALVEGYDDENP